jgi:ParB family transcriptional regulator, chromosome partitioning protein
MSNTSDSKQPVRKLGRGIGALIAMPPAVEVPVTPKVTPVATPAPVQASPVVEVKPLKPAAVSEQPVEDAIQYLELASIVPNPYQPRKVIDPAAIHQLAESIKHSGVMQPIIVRAASKPGGGGRFELVAGERRWRAAQEAKLKAIPAIVRVLSDEQSAEWALVENVQREDLNPIERGQALKALSAKFALTQSQLAERLGIERSTVANLIRLTELELEIMEMISRGDLTGGHGKALLSIPPGEARMNLAREAAANTWSVRKTELLAQAHAVKPEQVGTKAPKQTEVEARQAVLRDLERQVGHHLGTKVLITTDRTGAKGKLSIEFYSIDHFDGLLRKLGIPTQ